MSSPPITYCGNVHPAETLDAWLEVLRGPTAAVARASRASDAPFPIGVWWNAGIARRLARDPTSRDRVAEALRSTGTSIATLNVFPFGGFHDRVVKEAVYRPDWASQDRLIYTVDAARAVASLVEPGAIIPLSTLPLGFGDGDRAAMAANLQTTAREMALIEAEHGVRCVLALEPEPFCLLERAIATAEFLEQVVFSRASDAELLRRHLGVCVDLCHLAVVGEDAVDALRHLEAIGIEVPKIQVSSCLELRDLRELDRLLAFDEPRYLHQTVADDGALRARDLTEVRTRRSEFARATTLRTHFHVPLFWDDPGALGSTQREVRRVLRALGPRRPLLEVETYTWGVLDAGFRPEQDLVRGIVREIEWVREQVGVN